MKYIIAILFAALSFSSSAETLSQSLQFKTQDCMTNCATTIKIGSQWVVVAKGSSGEVMKLVTLDLDKSAKLVRNIQASGGASIMSSGHTTRQESETYVTNTEIVVVTTTFYFKDDELIGVKVDVARFPKFIEK